MENLSDRIKRLREEAKLSQAQLASKVDVSRVAVTKWESGQTENLKLVNLLGLCKVFGKTADELLMGSAQDAPIDTLHYIQPGSQNNHRACEPSHSTVTEWEVGSAHRAFPPDIEAAFLQLTDQGQTLVRTQLEVAIETARRIHGTRSGSSGSQTAA